MERGNLEQLELIGIAAGFGPENVPGLQEADAASEYFELLRGLTTGGPDDFLLRFGAVCDLVCADHTLWTLDALERRFCWMEPDRVLSVIRALRRSGWLESVGQAYRLTSDALAVYATLSRLSSLKRGRSDDLAMGVFDLEASTRLGEDRGPALRHLQHHLRRSIEDVEAAVESKSEVKVIEAREKLDRNLQWSRRARLLLDEMNVGEDSSYRAGQRLGRDLSELHRWHSVMQRVLDELSSNRVQFGGMGVRPTDISRWLIGLDVDELIELGGAHVSLPVWPLVCITDNVIDMSEHALLMAESLDVRQVGWREGQPEQATIGEAHATAGAAAFQAFESRVDAVAAGADSVSIADVLVAEDFQRTCYRMTLLALEDEQDSARVKVDVAQAKDGTLPTVRPEVAWVTELSAGQVMSSARGRSS